jgi:hypothetical protein
VSPLSDIELLLTFAEDNYIPRFNVSREALITDLENSLEIITNWLHDSGLSVNKNVAEPITIVLQNTNIITKSKINVLGIYFDSRLKWAPQVWNA